ncbi:hypothetical protein GCM10022627_36270 [Haloarcula argentinensis]|uniref:Uncharacterized protein n=2 Tax=Haloarcula argentinensis TaxID=43776 RepID=A0A830FRC0_HALAR|nr:hypothetical protein GCM10009006_34320 [Haloarcula argentinensis]
MDIPDIGAVVARVIIRAPVSTGCCGSQMTRQCVNVDDIDSAIAVDIFVDSVTIWVSRLVVTDEWVRMRIVFPGR